MLYLPVQLTNEFHNAVSNFNALASAQLTMRSDGELLILCLMDSVGGYVTAFHGNTAEFSTVHIAGTRIVLAFAAEHG